MKTQSSPEIGPHPADRARRPREGTFPRPSLAESDDSTRSFAGDTEGCCERGAWRGRIAAGTLYVRVKTNQVVRTAVV